MHTFCDFCMLTMERHERFNEKEICSFKMNKYYKLLQNIYTIIYMPISDTEYLKLV